MFFSDLQSSLELLHKRYADEQKQLNELLRDQNQAKLRMVRNIGKEGFVDANDDTLVETGEEGIGDDIRLNKGRRGPGSGWLEAGRQLGKSKVETSSYVDGVKHSSGEGSQPSDGLHIEDLEPAAVVSTKVRFL